MDPLTDHDKRLTDLEIKASFAEDLLDSLNQIIVRQQQDIARLLREVARLSQQARERGAELPGATAHEPPPHY